MQTNTVSVTPILKVKWDDDTSQLLKSMWLSGNTASEIALKIAGATRNAVLGRLHRMGLAKCVERVGLKPRKIEESDAAKLRGRPRAPRPLGIGRKKRIMSDDHPLMKFIAVEEIAPDDRSFVVEYLQLETRHCRALLADRGSDGLPLCCGKTRLRYNNNTWASSYCPQHAAQYQPGLFAVKPRG